MKYLIKIINLENKNCLVRRNGLIKGQLLQAANIDLLGPAASEAHLKKNLVCSQDGMG